jgi:protein gp37
MADKSKIEWLDGGSTWNPIRARNRITGKLGWFCTKPSPGCKGCYAERMNVGLFGNGVRYAVDQQHLVEIFLDEKTLLAPLHWKKPRLIFPCSMTDWQADFVPDEYRDKMMAVMALTPHHTYLTLTKRAERQREYLSAPELRARIAREANAMMRTNKLANSDALAHVFTWGRLEHAEPGEYANYLVGIADRCWPLPNVLAGRQRRKPEVCR